MLKSVHTTYIYILYTMLFSGIFPPGMHKHFIFCQMTGSNFHGVFVVDFKLIKSKIIVTLDFHTPDVTYDTRYKYLSNYLVTPHHTLMISLPPHVRYGGGEGGQTMAPGYTCVGYFWDEFFSGGLWTDLYSPSLKGWTGLIYHGNRRRSRQWSPHQGVYSL